VTIPAGATSAAPTRLERVLRLFAPVEPEEGVTSLILVANIFLILMAYYFIKPVREGWLAVSLFQGFSKLEVKAYSAFGQSLLLLLVVPLYASLAARCTRRQLIRGTGIVFGSLLILFWALQPGLFFEQVPFAGVGFYLVVGIFSVTLVAQFWSFASDVYGEERGRRLFPLVAVGASAGAAVGSWAGEQIVNLEWADAFQLILLALLPLAAAVTLALWTDRRGTYGHPSDWTQARWDEPAAPEGEGAFELIRKHRYLSATALMVVVFSWIVASGDNILFGLVQDHLQEQFADFSGDPAEQARLIKNATTAFYGDLFFWINLVGLLLQAFIVSRLLRFGGFGLLLIATPVISLVAYLSMAIAPVLGIIKLMKVAENASNYSVNNTARQMLWLPTSKAMLYQAKTAIDTLFVRLGDGLAALTVLVGTRVWPLEIIDFIIVNIVLVGIWLVVAAFLVVEHRRWVARSAGV
jgi:AAA family ATP:ADP antiporter